MLDEVLDEVLGADDNVIGGCQAHAGNGGPREGRPARGRGRPSRIRTTMRAMATNRVRWAPTLAVALACAVWGALWPAPARAAGPPPAPPVGATADAIAVHSLSLGEPGDFVTQYSSVACVGASVQTMFNMMRPGADRTLATQRRLLGLAQQLSDPVFVRRTGGASAMGWAYALEVSGGGPYRVRAFDTRDAALAAVVVAIRTTGRPAGLLVWAGVHAWVVSGFRTIGDPARGDARILDLVVSDPWWPRPANVHGRTIAPDSRVTPAAIASDFVVYRRGHPGFGSVMNGSFVVVLPIDPAVVREREERVL
jgi:hypothetical protein